LEAMAQGRLLVASDVGGHKELIRHGETGMLFKAGSTEALTQTLIDLLAAQELWPDMCEAGRQFVEKERNWTTSVANYARVYASLASRA
ncbi:MAG TPA: glycosyltransferase, partial [Rhodoferax sp.]|nr:glycosyltransferase [Rhodoferax sp.]